MPWLNISVMFIMKFYRFSLKLNEIDIRDEVRLSHRQFHGLPYMGKVESRLADAVTLYSGKHEIRSFTGVHCACLWSTE